LAPKQSEALSPTQGRIREVMPNLLLFIFKGNEKSFKKGKQRNPRRSPTILAPSWGFEGNS
jgi:hypothetical protein